MKPLAISALVLLAIALLGLAGCFFFDIPLPIMAIIAVIAAGSYVTQGIREVRVNPPCAGIVTYLGKPTGEIRGSGISFFPCFGWLYGFIEIDVTKKTLETIVEARTPLRQTEVRVPISITYSPDTTSCPTTTGHSALYEYLRSGKQAGVEAVLDEMFEQIVQTYISNPIEGPATWQEAQRSGERIVARILKRLYESADDRADKDKRIDGSFFETIPSSVPTEILIEYYSHGRMSQTESDIWSDRPELAKSTKPADIALYWGKVATQIAADAGDQTYASRVPAGIPYEDHLKGRIKERRKLISNLREGRTPVRIPGFGIRIEKISIGKIAPTSAEIIKAADKQEVESQERAGDQEEIQNVRDRIGELIGLGIGPKEAAEIVQSERGKIKKTVNVDRKEGSTSTVDRKEGGTTQKYALDLSPELTAVVRELALAIVGHRNPSQQPPTPPATT